MFIFNKRQELRCEFAGVSVAVFTEFCHWINTRKVKGCTIDYDCSGQSGVLTIKANDSKYTSDYWRCIGAFAEINELYYEE